MNLTPEEAMLIEGLREIDMESRELTYISAIQEFKDAKKGRKIRKNEGVKTLLDRSIKALARAVGEG